MSKEKHTREKLLDAAKKEFLEKGYYKASLRSICKEAGVTTGALYFFFEDKKNLFSNLVEEPVKEILEIISTHYKDELTGDSEYLNDNDDDDIAIAKKLIDYMYANDEILMLLLTKSNGSGYETFTDEIIQFTDEHYRHLADNLTDTIGSSRLSDYTIHWISHMIIEMFIDFFIHGLTKEEALEQVEIAIKFIKRGWASFFQ